MADRNRRQRTRRGHHRNVRHEAAAHGRTPPAILHPDAKSILGIGFGAGVWRGRSHATPIEHITICEIEPGSSTRRAFGTQNYQVYLNPKTHVVFDDARHYLLTTTDKFDIIASDPLDVFAKGTAAIYSKEYFDNIKRHLNPGGMFTLYVPLYESDPETVKSEIATFFDVFPNGTIWANDNNGQGYDVVLLGHSTRPGSTWTRSWPSWSADHAPVVQSMREVGVRSLNDLLSTYAGRNADLSKWSEGAELNTDADLRLQYLGGWGINSTLEDVIYRQMLAFRQLPNDLFTGSPERVDSLLTAIMATR